MEEREILQQAEKYISLEENDFFRNQVETLIKENNQGELQDRFYMDLAFGTGGLRGLIGGGFNRMNPYTVRRATQGLANYILKNVTAEKFSAAISYDNRNFSDKFALEAAKVLCGNGFTTYLYSGIRSTPQLSFAIRHLGATTGINITASHNPPEYNGYKAYWSDGCQVLSPHDTEIVAEAKKVSEIISISREEAFEKGLLVMINKEVDEPYISMVKSLSLRPQLCKERGKELTLVFTPLHGAGAEIVPRVLSEMGIQPVCVKEQMVQDGDFPTVTSPNPEEPSALKMALDAAVENKADIVLATDPDSDRLGIAVAEGSGYKLLSGNQLASLLAEYIFSGLQEKGAIPHNPAMVKTIVTTELLRKIAEHYNIACVDVLTGIKYIAGKINEFENEENGYNYIFGGEESFGYLIGTQVRDKDAVSSSMITAEMTLHYKTRGLTLLDQMDKIYEKYGCFDEILISRTFTGESGLQKIAQFMEKMRNNTPKTFAGKDIVQIKDYLDGSIRDQRTASRKKTIELPFSNVLQFILSDRSIVSVRPSGTEPKIKFYASCCESPDVALKEAKNNVQAKLQKVTEEIHSLIDG